MKWLYKKDLTDINSIKKVEDAFGIRFPSDYKDIVLAYNAATPWSC
ncbi:SMI1/KNR4 family protein [Pedobacter alluvionis]|nr:SMI1/KNR4 family protein [Pedobacter alluvionis]TFB30285.1 SMI1/KNR4 family protein [Pedobacter alluvionis]